MQRIGLLIGGAVLGALILAGCGGGDGTGSGADTEAYLPLAVNNFWQYDYTEYAAPGAAQTQSLRHRRARLFRPAGIGTAETPITDTVRVTGTEQIGGATWFTVVSQYTGDSPTPPIFVRHNSQGLIVRRSETDPGYYLLRNPVREGNTWVDQFDARYAYTITGTGQTASVPADIFNDCAIVEEVFSESGQPDEIITSWYARNVGLVREEYHVGTTLVDKLELTAYSVAP